MEVKHSEAQGVRVFIFNPVSRCQQKGTNDSYLHVLLDTFLGLKELLGGGKDKKKMGNKVPVVIDPRLCKVLRPHQIEGVKVWLTLQILLVSLHFTHWPSAVPVQVYYWHGR